MKKIISYNVNGIRAALKKGLIEWINDTDVDVICIQETKAMPEQIPVLDFEMAGYRNYWFSAKKRGYSGVAILTKQEPDNVVYGMNNRESNDEGRFLRVDFNEFSIASVYVPSGSSGEKRQTFKMKWLKNFNKFVVDLKKEKKNLIIAGDYNICHKSIDIYDPIRNATSSGFLPEERAWLTDFLNIGFCDSFRYFNDEPDNYTWWSYRAGARIKNKGWRIDYQMVSENLKNNIRRSLILSEVKHSDHCPVYLELEI